MNNEILILLIIDDVIQASSEAAQQTNHRQLIQLVGDLDWSFHQVASIVQKQSYFWIGDAPQGTVTQQYNEILGQECDLLIINALNEFDANAFSAAEGTLKGGGLLILLTPHQIDPNNHFYHYINAQLSKYPFLTITQGKYFPRPLLTSQLKKVEHQLNLTQQKQAIVAIKKTVTGHRRRPLVLTANRGRGKSAALGIAAKELIDSGIDSILICAPNKQATTTFFKHAGNKSNITFIAPDLLLQTKPACSLLIIDEAAALPVPMLESITRHYSRLVFSTTLHGYEGSGRGFALRFQAILKQISPEYRTLHLDQPIRWAVNDPLESFTLNSLCLTEFNQSAPFYNEKRLTEFVQISQHELLHNKILLQSIFALLVTAHYQTKPSDLKILLNDADLSIFILRQENQVLGVVLINHEGQINNALSNDIFQGVRRIKGNLVPQSLALHCGFKEACSQSFARIQRIAIYPSLQNNGLGSLFIAHIKQWSIQQKFDHLCTAFGATEQLTRFWHRHFFTPLRMGTTKDKSSGTFTLIMNIPLSKKGSLLNQAVLTQFETQFPFYLSRHLQTLDPLIILFLLKKPVINDNYHLPALLESYLSGNLQYQHIEFTLMQLLLTHKLSTLPINQQKLYILKVLQNQSWPQVSQQLGFTGKKQAQQALKAAIQQLIGNNNETR